MSLVLGSALNLKQVSSTPAESVASGETLLYVKNGVLYSKDVASGSGSTGEQRYRPEKSVRVATTSAITLSGTQTIDGVSCSVGDRVLVRAQGVNSGNAYDNGIWVVAAGAWARATDADTSAEIAGCRVFVNEGASFGGMVFETNFKSTDTLGSTGLAFFGGSRMETGTGTQRPLASGAGHVFFNDVDRYLDIYSGTAWVQPKGIPDIGTVAPSAPKTGELWYDTSVSGTRSAPLMEVFTASGTWTKASGAKTVVVEVVGGGGAGGGSGTAASGAVSKGAGGGGGGYAKSTFAASSLSATESIAVGQGGAGTLGGNGGNGAGSAFGAHVAVSGGSGGIAVASNAADFWTSGGSGGTATTGDISVPGQQGGPCNGSGSLGTGGDGGDTPLGYGARGRTAASAGQNLSGLSGTGYGAGGGGALSTSTGASATGGNGADGVVIVTTYFV